ncbi:MAG: hypothetical protein JWM47_3469 [Acidimicrobiales bacterium]|nr:hypothetical protein [Acidimicrobiales bacterium]
MSSSDAPSSAPLDARAGQPRRWSVLVIAALLACSLASCVLREGNEYVAQPAPPNGIHATIRSGPSSLLVVVSDLVRKGQNPDKWLVKTKYRTRCNAYPRTAKHGDRCAFRLLRESRTTGILEKGWWNDATNWDMLTDFHRDAMGPFRSHRKRMRAGCLHVTIRNVGDWPIEWKNSNWTVRTRSDPKC